MTSKASRAAYRERNRERIREAQRRWYANLPEDKKRARRAASRAYYRKNKGWIRVVNSAWSAQWYRNLKAQVFAKYGTVCAYCQQDDYYQLEIDHIDEDGKKDRKLQWEPSKWFQLLAESPKRRGLQTLCQTCNKKKSMFGPDRRKWPTLTVADILNRKKAA